MARARRGLQRACIAMLAAAFAAGGCGGDDGGGNGEPPAASVNVSLGPIAQTQQVEFDEVPVGSSQTKTIVVSNDTDTEQTIEELKLGNDPQFRISDGTCGPGTKLSGGEKCTVDVTFTPQRAGESEVDFSVVSDRAGRMTAQMSGRASAATTTETTTTTPTETTPEMPPTETSTTDTPPPETSTTGG